MAKPTPPSPLVGHSIVALTDEPRPPSREIDVPDGAGLAAAAAATPFVRRLAATAALVAERGALAWPVLRDALPPAGPAEHYAGGVAGPDRAALLLLMLAVERDLLGLTHRGDPPLALVTPGSQTGLIHEHPLAVWGEPLLDLLRCDLVGATVPSPQWFDRAMAAVPMLIFQRLVMAARPVSLAQDATALHRELLAAAPGDGEPVTRRDVARRVATILALLAEFGVVAWRRSRPTRLGRACITGLGLFGWLLWSVEEHGMPPTLDRELQQHGYLPANGGYIPPDALPFPISRN